MRLNLLHPFINLLIALVALALITSCSDRSSHDKHLGEGKMEDVLYDLHLAQGLALQSPSDSIAYYTRLYRQEVFEKHGISEADFDSSMIWYGAHIDRLGKIYDALADRFGGGDDNGPLIDPTGSFGGDTISIWRGPSGILLSSQGRNQFTYVQPADTALRKGDRLIWSFDTAWYYHDGARQLYAVLTVEYDGDSLNTQIIPIFSSGEQSLSLTLAKEKVKTVKCLLYQATDWSERPRLIAVSHIRLTRVRSLPLPATEPDHESPAGDSAKAQPRVIDARLRIRDSLLRADSAARHGNHFR